MHCIYRDNTLNATGEGTPITLVPLMGKFMCSMFYGMLQGEGSLPVLMCLAELK